MPSGPRRTAPGSRPCPEPTWHSPVIARLEMKAAPASYTPPSVFLDVYTDV